MFFFDSSCCADEQGGHLSSILNNYCACRNDHTLTTTLLPFTISNLLFAVWTTILNLKSTVQHTTRAFSHIQVLLDENAESIRCSVGGEVDTMLHT